MIKTLKVFFEIKFRHEMLHSDLPNRNIETTCQKITVALREFWVVAM